MQTRIAAHDTTRASDKPGVGGGTVIDLSSRVVDRPLTLATRESHQCRHEIEKGKCCAYRVVEGTIFCPNHQPGHAA